MTSTDFANLCSRCVEELRKLAPKDTGNLAYNAIKFEFPDTNTCKIIVDEAIAPYMPYTNEPWIAERWHGKKNPNEKWFDNAAEKIAQLFAQLSRGELKR